MSSNPPAPSGFGAAECAAVERTAEEYVVIDVRVALRACAALRSSVALLRKHQYRARIESHRLVGECIGCGHRSGQCCAPGCEIAVHLAAWPEQPR